MSKVWCPLPWVRVYNGWAGYSPCCWAPAIKFDSIKDYLESDFMTNLRADILSGRPNEYCVKCHKAIEVGDQPMAEMAREMYSNIELDTNLKSAILKFSKICNLKCRMCSPRCSSAIAVEQKQQWVTDRDDQVFDDLKYMVTGLDQIQFEGGESLLAKQHYDALEWLCKSGHASRLRLQYVTNGTVVSFKGTPLGEYWKPFPKVKVVVSINAIGPQLEYWHHGVEWEKLVENLHYFKSLPNVELDFTAAITWATAHRTLDAAAWAMREFGIPIRIHKVFQCDGLLDLSVMPFDMRPELIARLNQYIIDAPDFHRNTLRGMVLELQNKDKTEVMTQALEWITRIDDLRGEDFFKVFPEHEDMRPYLT